MDHFKSAVLKNFGPWKNQLFEFHEGVNVFIGQSGHGKSAILKALDFALNNQTPKSANGALGFITRPLERGKIAEVDIEMFSGKEIDKISRRKGKSVNEYQLNDNKPQKAMGTNVPDHIAKIINMKSVNYHKQKHLPFLLDEKPGQVAKQLSDIINLQEIDETVSSATSSVRENRKILKAEIQDNEDLLKQINDLGYVQEFKAKIDSCIALESKFHKQVSMFDKTDSILHDIDTLQSQIAQFEHLIRLSDAVDAVNRSEAKFEADSDRFDKIVELVNDIEEFELKQKRNLMLIDLGKKIESAEEGKSKTRAEKNKCSKIRNILIDISELKNRKQKFKSLIVISDKIEKLDILQKELEDKTNKYNQVLNCFDSICVADQDREFLNVSITENELKLSKMECPLCHRKN